MATFDEVSARLMKPAKELADWNFPLAKVLEEYYTLRSAQDDANYSNAALVVQNCTNVYVRRVELLYNGTRTLSDSFVEQEAAEKAKKESKKNAKAENSFIDTGDFEAIDFTKFIGKNNNIKTRTGTNNSVKLLSQRFPQLENISRSSLPIEVYDVHGEVVGKKYDFRCNEYVTASGMLVEHLTPEDFPSVTSDGSEPKSTNSPNSVIDLLASLESTVSPEDDSDIHEDNFCQDDCDNSCVVHDEETGLMNSSFTSSIDSGVGSSIQSSIMRPDSSLSSIAENHWESTQSRPGSSLSTVDMNSLPGRDSVLSGLLNRTLSNDDQRLQSPEKRNREEMEKEDSPVDNQIDEGATEVDCSTENAAGCTLETSIEVAAAQTRRSKRLKNVIDDVNDLNPKQWEPIPFNGVPDNVPPSIIEFKVPLPISLLKGKPRPRKRSKLSPQKLSLTDCCTSRKKLSMYSPTRQLFLPLKKEYLEDFKSCLEAFDYEAVETFSMDLLGFRTKIRKSDRDIMTNLESGIDEFSIADEQELIKRLKVDSSNCAAVTNISMDLLGFKTNVPKPDPVVQGVAANIIDVTENIEDSVVDDFPMPETPESSDDSLETEISPPTPSLGYHSRIEQSVRDIYDSEDVRTDQEDAIAKWHEFIKPKLKEAERRTPFDMTQYSQRVIENLKTKSDRKIKFAEMVHHHEPTEVARYFLATLQLANKYNLDIGTSNNVEGNFTLALLDTDTPGGDR